MKRALAALMLVWLGLDAGARAQAVGQLPDDQRRRRHQRRHQRPLGHRAARPRFRDRTGRRRQRRNHLGRGARPAWRDRGLCAGAARRAQRRWQRRRRALHHRGRRAADRRPHRRRLHRAAADGALCDATGRTDDHLCAVRRSRPAASRPVEPAGRRPYAQRSARPGGRDPDLRSAGDEPLAPVRRLRPRGRVAHLDRLRPHPVPAVAAAARRAVVARPRRWQPAATFREAFVDVFKIVTAFTVAHSITLSLATLGVVTLPSRWVESAIAASVVLAALNNVCPGVPRPALDGGLRLRPDPWLRLRQRAGRPGPAARGAGAGAGRLQPRRRGRPAGHRRGVPAAGLRAAAHRVLSPGGDGRRLARRSRRWRACGSSSAPSSSS